MDAAYTHRYALLTFPSIILLPVTADFKTMMLNKWSIIAEQVTVIFFP